MGSLYYGSTEAPIHFPDRLLAHLKVVVATKLRRGESFTLSWRHTDASPGGRSTIWIQPSIALRFVFESVEAEQLNAAFLQELAVSANSSGGLSINMDQLIPDSVDRPRRLSAAAVA
ncbi:hypothetical protein FHX49_001462 [Microbacterium endophyticum]|uniref:DUF7882 domain-containing protein n=1 Tax=Microbacterium endophyticum TaxID=1526412 RepID=A0A7W4YLX9_9MICO|nr:hypothetical protein [Microbacterium endophyticum]MBB2975895.1 hypothetical protein [Microbacterium endophyticum]NIK36378.1 hypothetical protein [Microbacterium endophyticum]